MASYSKRGDRYQIRWRDPDGTNRAYTCPDVRTTRKVLSQIEECSALGEIWRSPREVEVPSLPELSDAYIRDVKRLRAPATAEQREIAIANFLEFVGADEKHWRGPRELTKANLEGFYEYMTTKRGCTASYAGENVRKVERWWKWLGDEDRWGERVIPSPKRIELPAPLPIPAAVAPTWEEMDRVVEAADGYLIPLFFVLRFTGLREQQAMRLLWTDLDFEGRELHIRPALGKTKSEKQGRRIPVSKHLVDGLAGWGKREGFLVPAAHPTRSVSPKLSRQAWEKAGVRELVWKQRIEDGRRVYGHPTHAFRKGIESGLIALGADALAVEHLLGHKLPGTLSNYLDPTTLPLREAVDLIPGLGETPKVTRLTTPENQARSQGVRKRKSP